MTDKSAVMMRLLRSDISWPTYVLVVIFGLGSWLAMDGLWVELPVLVEVAPEKWDLPSYLTVIIQLANIGPLAYSIGSHFAPRTVTEKPVILCIVLIGAIACALLAFFWDKTSFIGGVEHSTALLVLSFFMSIVDCTSSVVFLTFMGSFPSHYMSALFVGETLSGMLPSFVALGQGVGKRSGSACNKSSVNVTNTSFSGREVNAGLNFGPEVFFLALFPMMIACGAAFLGLNYLPVARREQVKSTTERSSDAERQRLTQSASHANCEDNINNISIADRALCSSSRDCHIIFLLCIQAWVNFLANGVVSSILTFASEPYGSETYHLALILAYIGSALVCFIALWLPSRSSTLVMVFASLCTLLTSYIVVLAAMSPTPPLHTSRLGSALVIFVNVASSALVNYTKLTICTIMKERGQRALFWCGISIQAGSCIGAVVMFPLVNVFKLFHEAQRC